jgi:glycosyltransferase involved in cell wall biosynthesis
MKFTVLGSIFDTSGYAIHSRQLFNALAKQSDVKLITGLTQNWLREVNDLELEAIKKEDSYDRIKIIITHPVYWRVNCTNKRNWVYCIWEGDKVPKYFIEEMRNKDIEKIIVASEHTRQAIAKTLYELQKESLYQKFINEDIAEKIVLINHGVNHEIFKPLETKKEKLTFLINKGFRNMMDRGGSQYSLKAYLEEFKKGDNVRLILKINPAYGIPDLNKIIKDMVGERDDLPEIIIDFNSYQYSELGKLYNQADVFLATTRAEAFNLPVIEAMACGLPVIYTNFGGQAEYAEGWAIPYELEEVKHEIQYEGISWATPKIEEIRKIMREIYSVPEKAVQFGTRAIEKAKDFSWDKCAKQFIDIYNYSEYL